MNEQNNNQQTTQSNEQRQDNQNSYKQSPQFQRDQSEAEARTRGDESFVNWGYWSR